LNNRAVRDREQRATALPILKNLSKFLKLFGHFKGEMHQRRLSYPRIIVFIIIQSTTHIDAKTIKIDDLLC